MDKAALIAGTAYISGKVTYGKSVIRFSVVEARRKTLAISVLPDMAVEVKAPAGGTPGEIERKVKKRAG